MSSVEANESNRELQRLLDEAIKQPGVAEVMAVFESWREADRIANEQKKYEDAQYRISLSTMSIPVANSHP